MVWLFSVRDEKTNYQSVCCGKQIGLDGIQLLHSSTCMYLLMDPQGPWLSKAIHTQSSKPAKKIAEKNFQKSDH
jgi:hypothetical protein